MESTFIRRLPDYNVCVAQDERGRKVAVARIEGNTACGFVQFIEGLEGQSKVAIEACWNCRIHDLLEAISGVTEVVVGDPWKTRLIADAQVKTDKIDGNALATLLRGNFIARRILKLGKPPSNTRRGAVQATPGG